MLELLLAELNDDVVPVSNACISLGGAQSTALRVLNRIERMGLVRSHADHRDGRRRLLRLTDTARDVLTAHLANERFVDGMRFNMNVKIADASRNRDIGRLSAEDSHTRHNEPSMDAVISDLDLSLRRA